MDLCPEDVIEQAEECFFYIRCTEAQAQLLASGFTPNAVRAMAHTMISWAEQDEQRAARPIMKVKKVRRPK